MNSSYIKKIKIKMSEKKESSNIANKSSEKNINPVSEKNNPNASQTSPPGANGSSITVEKPSTNIEQQNNLMNQLNPNQKSMSTIQQNTAYPNSHWVVLESILERNGLATKPTNFSLEIIGIYSIPEFWIKMDQSGAVDSWGYQVVVGEAKCVNGKLNVRELTDEEKSAIENKKKPPPKIDKKNPDAVKAEEERLKKIQDEKDLMEKKFYEGLKELEPIQQYYKIKEMPTQAEWISFSNEDKINTVELKDDKLIDMEDAINDEHRIIIEVNKVPPPDENEKKRPKPKNMNPEDIKPIYSVGLADLTEFYNIPGKKEVILRTPLMKKETYIKRKENHIEPLQPVFEPKENDLKVYLFGPPQPAEGSKKEKEKESSHKTEKGKASNTENSQGDSDYIEDAHTYVYYKLKFSESINPKISGFEEQIEDNELSQPKIENGPNTEPNKPVDILSNVEEKEDINKSQDVGKKSSKDTKEKIKEEEKKGEEKIQGDKPEIKLDQKNNLAENNRYEKENVSSKKILEEKEQPILHEKKEEKKEIEEEEEEPKVIGAKQICTDFRKYIKIFIASICKNYDELIGGDSSKNQAAKREKSSMINNVKKEERDLNINKFLQKFLESGKANLIKEKLKKFITRIALEKYKKRIEVNENFDKQRERFFSEIYAYVSEEVKLGMDEYIYMKRDEIHEHILSSYDQSRKEILNYAIRKNKEPEEKRLLRLSNEYEILDDLGTAMQYYKSRLTLIQNQESWLGFAILAKKMNNLTEVEEAIKYCIQNISDGEHIPVQSSQNSSISDEFTFKILYASIKYLKGRMKDALSIMLTLLDKYKLKKTNCNFNAFLAFLFHESKKKLLFTKHYEAAKRFKMLELGMDLRKPKFNPKVKIQYKSPSLTNEQCNSIWYNLINLFNDYEFYEISNKLLEFIDDEGKQSIEFKIQQAKIALFFKDYDKSISICNEILKIDDQNYFAWMLRGHAFYFKKNLFDSEESYIKGIKYKPRNTKFDIKMLTRLGVIYIGRKTWNDAKTVFLHILKESTYHSFAWRYLGLALTNLEEYSSAEEALDEAISLDIENPFAWAYLTIFCIKVERKEQALACLNELIKMKFKNVETTSDIAMLFYKNNDYNIAANLYRRVMIIDKTYIDAQVKLAEIYFMKFEEPKKKEAIDILKNAIQYAMDEKEKNGIMELIQIYENQMDNNSQYNGGGFSNNDSDNVGKSGQMGLSLHSNANGEDSEIKDNFN